MPLAAALACIVIGINGGETLATRCDAPKEQDGADWRRCAERSCSRV